MGTEVFLGMPPPNVAAWIRAKKAKTYVKYTAASGLSDWEEDIVGELSYESIPNLSDIAEVEIGSHVTGISSYAFYGCSGLTSVMIPNSVEFIGDDAFYGCSGLTSVTIPYVVFWIGAVAFSGCTGLTSVTFSGKDKTTVQGMDNYSWELPSGCVLHCTDGDISIQ